MELDDDMLVVVIDGEDISDTELPVKIKQEIDDRFEEVIEKITKHGQQIDIKKEPEIEAEYLDAEYSDTDPQSIKQELNDENEDSDQNKYYILNENFEFEECEGDPNEIEKQLKTTANKSIELEAEQNDNEAETLQDSRKQLRRLAKLLKIKETEIDTVEALDIDFSDNEESERNAESSEEMEDRVTSSKRKQHRLNRTTKIEEDIYVYGSQDSQDEEEEYLDVDEDDAEYIMEEDESDQEDIKYVKEKDKHRRRKMRSPWEAQSFVDNIREVNPDLSDELLILALVEAMKDQNPPELPRDYFVMDGIYFQCIKCGKNTASQAAAGRHYRERHGPRYLICFACGVDFRSKTDLYKHEKKCRAADAGLLLAARRRYLCRDEPRRPYMIKDKTNSGEGGGARFPCPYCPSVFRNKTGLTSHVNKHEGVRPYRCRVCPAAYTARSALARHKLKHGAAGFVCDHCGRAFTVKAALVTHMDTHLPVKRFGCPDCPKRYSQKAALVRHHASKHAGLPPPAACLICPRRYPRMSLLKEHMKKEHGLSIMTRKMFFRKLPTIPDDELHKAMGLYSDYIRPIEDIYCEPDQSTQLQEELLHYAAQVSAN